MEAEPIKFHHFKGLDRLEWILAIVFCLVALFYYTVEGIAAFTICSLVAIRSFYKLGRTYLVRSRTPYALTLSDEYIHTQSALVSRYNFPIAWQDIKAIIETTDKKNNPAEYAVLLLNEPTKILGEVLEGDIKKARKLSKSFFVSGLRDDTTLISEDDIELNYKYLLNSILYDLSSIDPKNGELLKKIEQYSGHKLYGVSYNDFTAKELTPDKMRKMIKELVPNIASKTGDDELRS